MMVPHVFHGIVVTIETQEHADAWALIGNLHLAKYEWGPEEP